MKLNYSIFSFIASVLFMFAACMPEEYELGKKELEPADLVEGIAYSVTHDPANPNISLNISLSVYIEYLHSGKFLLQYIQYISWIEADTINIKMP